MFWHILFNSTIPRIFVIISGLCIVLQHVSISVLVILQKEFLCKANFVADIHVQNQIRPTNFSLYAL
jgi:hypothetical protein